MSNNNLIDRIEFTLIKNHFEKRTFIALCWQKEEHPSRRNFFACLSGDPNPAKEALESGAYAMTSMQIYNILEGNESYWWTHSKVANVLMEQVEVFLYWKLRRGRRGWTLEQATRYSTSNASQHSALNLFIFDHCNTSGFHVMKWGQGQGHGEVRLRNHIPSSWACRHGRGGHREKKNKPQDHQRKKKKKKHSNV